jgi:hypothetical protein
MAAPKPTTEKVSANEIRRRVKSAAVPMPAPAPPPAPISADFIGYAQAYLGRGWWPLPLPAGKKFPPATDATGSTGTVTQSKVEMWERLSPKGNIALRLDGVVGLDIDARDRDGEQWAAWEAWVAEHGALPATWSSTSRGADQPSRILYFRVPRGVDQQFASKADWGDVIQRNHRYAVVAPSLHPEGGQYRWYAPDGSLTPLDVVPEVGDLPVLPAAWVAALQAPAKSKANNEPITISTVTWDTSRVTDALLAEALSKPLAELDLMRSKKWVQGDSWDQRVFDAACILVRIANSPWFDFDLAEVRRLLQARGPQDEGWSMADNMAKLDGAIAATIGDVWFSKRVAARDAQGNAFRDDSEDHNAADDDLQIYRRSDLRNMPPVSWILEGLIQKNTTCLLAGPPNIGKSWLMLDLMARWALGLDFFGREVQKQTVFYIAAEGINAFDRRMTAWESANRHQIPDDAIWFARSGVNISDPIANARLGRALVKLQPDVIIFDTFAQLSGVESENDATAVGDALKNVSALRDLVPGATCIVVHHTGKGGDVRGSSALQGDPDTVLIVKEAGHRAFSLSTLNNDHGKQKDGDTERWDGFELAPVYDDDENDIGAVIIHSDTPRSQPADRILTLMEEGVGYTTKQVGEFLGVTDTNGMRRVREQLAAHLREGRVSATGETKNRRWKRVE